MKKIRIYGGKWHGEWVLDIGDFLLIDENDPPRPNDIHRKTRIEKESVSLMLSGRPIYTQEYFCHPSVKPTTVKKRVNTANNNFSIFWFSHKFCHPDNKPEEESFSIKGRFGGHGFINRD